jgi:hypothetical protein
MQMVPHSKEEWLRFLVFPFKAYVAIGPVLFGIVASIPLPRLTAGEAAIPALELLFADALILLIAAGLFALFGPKGHALSCVGFAAVALIVALALLQSLAAA